MIRLELEGTILAAQLRALELDPPDQAADQAVEAVRRTTPVRTGRLVSSVSGHATAQGITITAGAPYASFVARRNPFITRGLERSRAELAETWDRTVQTQLDRLD